MCLVEEMTPIGQITYCFGGSRSSTAQWVVGFPTNLQVTLGNLLHHAIARSPCGLLRIQLLGRINASLWENCLR